MNSLKLNDGWTQIPPKEDGEYWFASAKPWHAENAYDPDLVELVRIKGGKRIEVMDGYAENWLPPECESPDNPVWDSASQFELLAAWRPKLDGESFSNLPPKIVRIIFERHPETCRACGKMAATYNADVWSKYLNGKTSQTCPCICYSCGHVTMMEKDYFDKKAAAEIKKAFENAGIDTWDLDL